MCRYFAFQKSGSGTKSDFGNQDEGKYILDKTNGFGKFGKWDSDESYWLPLENVHETTMPKDKKTDEEKWELLLVMRWHTTAGGKRGSDHIILPNFKVQSVVFEYTITFDRPKSITEDPHKNWPDSYTSKLMKMNGMPFTTQHNDNDAAKQSCANDKEMEEKNEGAGWWYNGYDKLHCAQFCLNCRHVDTDHPNYIAVETYMGMRKVSK